MQHSYMVFLCKNKAKLIEQSQQGKEVIGYADSDISGWILARKFIPCMYTAWRGFVSIKQLGQGKGCRSIGVARNGAIFFSKGDDAAIGRKDLKLKYCSLQRGALNDTFCYVKMNRFENRR